MLYLKKKKKNEIEEKKALFIVSVGRGVSEVSNVQDTIRPYPPTPDEGSRASQGGTPEIFVEEEKRNSCLKESESEEVKNTRTFVCWLEPPFAASQPPELF